MNEILRIAPKIQELLGELEQVEEDLGRADVVSDQTVYKELTRRHSYLLELQEWWERYQTAEKELSENKQLLKGETDLELQELLIGEIDRLSDELSRICHQLESLIVPPSELDDANTMVELRAGTGGDEAALFVGDCARMYACYANRMRWKYEILSTSPSEAGGFKEYIFLVSGKGVYRHLEHEGGTHRVQRVPETESQGRIHTSAITVAVIPELTRDYEVVIEDKDLRIDTFRSSGAGGQHVNTTDSAVRITHIPTNIVVSCQDERSQIKNRDKAMKQLRIKLAERKRREIQAQEGQLRKEQVGSGDRSERIRTYNYPQNRVTDHRIGLTLYKLDAVMEGDLDQVILPLITHFYQKQFET